MIEPSNYPPNMMPLPEQWRDYLILGLGGSFQVPEAFEGISSYRGTSPWTDDTSWEGSAPESLYAAPPNSAIVRANLPPLPEGARILGWGGSFTPPTASFRGWAINHPFTEWGESDRWSGTSIFDIYAIMEEAQAQDQPVTTRMLPSPSECPFPIPEGNVYLGWIGPNDYGGGDYRFIYAARETPMAEEPHPDLETSQATPAMNILPKPSDFPGVVPEGYILLGKGGSFTADQNLFEGRICEVGSSTWRGSRMHLGTNHDFYYCVPANSRMARLNLPPLHPDAVIVGYGSPTLGPIRGGFRLRLERPNPIWEGPSDFEGDVENCIYAIMPAITQTQEVQVEEPQQQKAALQWHVTIGGSALSTWDEVYAAVLPFLSDSSNQIGATNAIDEAMRVSDPDLFIESWIDKEPALISMLEWIPLASTQGVDIHAIAESNATIADVITKAAAGVMLRGGFSSHFRYLEDGTLAIDPSSPPTVDQAYELLRRTLEIKETASKLDNYSAWMLGMIADQFEVYFGERFDPSVIMQQTSRAYNTYVCSLGTFRAWWTERRNLSFTHHREVQYAKHLDHNTGGQVLDLSERFKLTVLQQRKLISYAKRFDIANLEGEMGELEEGDVEGLMERIDIRAVNKRYLFFLRTTNKWFEYKGPFENIPNGASPIINADTRQIMGQDGQATKPDEWVPVGVIASPSVLESVGVDVADEEDEEDEE